MRTEQLEVIGVLTVVDRPVRVAVFSSDARRADCRDRVILAGVAWQSNRSRLRPN